ncbi:hypothetical protein GE09DRAFT_618151 [Coniochaeta sp. 2T2.1]|nr:hypothetical protein GE09DRAFT_618151 [Coniochaeta sp. 2T2.1]
MAPKEIAYEALREDERSSDEVHHAALLHHYALQTTKESWTRIICAVCMLAMLISNAVWFGIYNHQKNVQARPPTVFPVPFPYRFTSEYVDGSRNMSEENQLWADLFPRGGGAVKVDSQWAINTGLQPTQGYARDGMSVYVVAMYHQLHCITVIRTSLYQSYYGRKQHDPWGHITHCLDTLLQVVQCLADPTLGGVDAIHECRDFKALEAWTDENKYTDNLDFDLD